MMANKDPLIRTLIQKYFWNFAYAFLINFFLVILETSTPFLLWMIIEYIKTPDSNNEDLKYGIWLISLFLLIELVSKLISQHVNFVQEILGSKAYTGVMSMVYKKILKYSSATNKTFTQGEIINFLQIDSTIIIYIAKVLPTVVRLPIQMIFAIWYLTYFFGFSFFLAIGILGLIMLINYTLSIFGQKIQSKIFLGKDKRMTLTAELINSVKIIKSNCWVKHFSNRLEKARQNEINSIKWYSLFMALNILIQGWTTPILILTTFGVFFYAGHTISLGKGMAALLIFNNLTLYIDWIPCFIGTLTQFQVSMRRIEKFLQWDEINPRIIHKYNSEAKNNGIDVLVQNANFSWGWVGVEDQRNQQLQR